MSQVAADVGSGAIAGSMISPGLGTAIGAGIGLIGGGLSYLGGEQSNAATAKSSMLAMMNANNQLGETQTYNTIAADKSMQFSSQEAQKARDFGQATLANQQSYETAMSNTAYQRAVAGMKAAGLNPILSAGTGGASTPQIGAPTSPSPSGTALGASPGGYGNSATMQNALAGGVSSALQGAKVYGDLQSTIASTNETSARTKNVQDANPAIQSNNKTAEIGPAQAAADVYQKTSQGAAAVASAVQAKAQADLAAAQAAQVRQTTKQGQYVPQGPWDSPNVIWNGLKSGADWLTDISKNVVTTVPTPNPNYTIPPPNRLTGRTPPVITIPDMSPTWDAALGKVKSVFGK